MLHIQFNGKPYALTEPNLSLRALLDHESLAKKRIAVELNRKIIPRSQYDSIMLKSGDQVEIVAAIGGG